MDLVLAPLDGVHWIYSLAPGLFKFYIGIEIFQFESVKFKFTRSCSLKYYDENVHKSVNIKKLWMNIHHAKMPNHFQLHVLFQSSKTFFFKKSEYLDK